MTVANTDSLSEADSLLEQNRFAQARDAYRSALISGFGSRKAIANLGIADNEERLAFWRSLLDRYPQEAEYRTAYVNELMLSGHVSQAMQACTGMLKTSTETRGQLIARLLRLRAAARSGMFDYFVEDFREVWNSGGIVSGFDRLRRTLLEVISGCVETTAISCFEILAKEPLSDGPVGSLIEAKVAELQAMLYILRG